MKSIVFQNSSQTENLRAAEFFREQQLAVYKRTDRIFSVLLPIQWLAAIIAANFLTPLTWNGAQSTIHPRILVAIFVGGLITLVPLYLTIVHSGETITRYLVGICQMLMSGVLIHVTGGRIETHFHIFGSLAFLACYRDWRVLIPATLVTAADHYFRGWLDPLAIYGIIAGTEWRWVELSGWVVFTDIFLIVSCRRSVREMWNVANRNALLDASEERYRTVIEQMTESIFLLEPESFRVIECNGAFVDLIGCKTIEEAKQLTAFEFDTGKPDEIRQMTKILREQRKSLTTVRKYRRNDGSLIHVEITGRFIFYNDTNAFCVNARDITERKKAEVELKRLALVAQKTQNAVVITDPNGNIQWVNEGFTRITKYSFTEVVGKKPGHFLQGEKTSSETVSKIRQALADREPFAGELYNYGKDGKGYWLSLSIMPINGTRGELKGFIAVEMDISERKSMEEQLQTAYEELELRISARTAELVRTNEQMKAEVNERKRVQSELTEAQQFLRKVIDDIPSLIFVKDLEGRFILANRALAGMFGTSPERMIGKTYGDFNTNKDEVELYRADDELVIDNLEERLVYEEKLTDVNGVVHWLQTIKRPLIGDSGVESILGIATDFTERKILESQLRHSQKMESIGQLAAGIAHEINTPTQYVGDNTRFISDAFTDINSVLTKYNELFELVRAGKVSEEMIKEVSDEIENTDLEYLTKEIPNAIKQSLEGVSRIAKIVQSMKNFAHPGTGEKTGADLNQAIESTITVAKNEWKYVADIETNFDQTLPLVPCLLGEFNQVVLNMVINASHAIADVVGDGSKGKGKIKITTTRVNDDWAEIRIGDTGTGIPPEVQGRIFDPFFTTKEVGKGTGQGLAISHTVVVDKHNGQLHFETVPGNGTTFIIRLPLAENRNPVQNG